MGGAAGQPPPRVRGQVEYSWRQLLAVRSRELYPITDIRAAKRFGSVIWLWGTLVIAILLPFAPPDQSSLGAAGWLIAAAVLVAGLLYGVRLMRSSRSGATQTVTPQEILLADYLATVLITVLNLLAGDQVPYEELLLIAALYTAAVFSPRVIAVYMVAVALALLAPLLNSEAVVLSEQVVRLVVWSGLAIAASMLLVKQRLERASLLERGAEAEIEARADPLTGLGNRRAFDEALGAASSRAARTGSSLSVIIADIEAFKAINDGWGLIAGDRLLREVATALDGAVRSPDACFRWGGDEFVVLADIDGGDAGTLGERLAEEVGGSVIRPDGERVRLYVGSAELSPESGDPDEILGAASRAMKPASHRRG